MQNWEQHIEKVLSDMRTTEVPFGIEQRIIARLSMKRVIHLVRASVGKRDRFKTRGPQTVAMLECRLVLLLAPSSGLFTEVDIQMVARMT